MDFEAKKFPLHREYGTSIGSISTQRAVGVGKICQNLFIRLLSAHSNLAE
jgi:hypothetical protein